MNKINVNDKLKYFAVTSGIFAAALFFSGWISEKSEERKLDLLQITLSAENNLRRIEATALQATEKSLSFENNAEQLTFFSSANLAEQGITILIYRNDELTAWSGSDVTFVSIGKLLSDRKYFVHLPNGWYEILVREKANSKAVIFISVCSDYAYQNKYLVNEFNSALKIPDGIALAETDAKYFVRSSDGKNIFGIKESVIISTDETKFPFAETTDMAAIIMLLVCCVCIGRILFHHNSLLTVIYSLAIAGARVAMIYFKLPGPLYQTSLFSPQFYASSFLFGSAGDLFLNTAFVLAIILIYYRHQRIVRFFSSAESRSSTAAVFYILWALIIVATSLAVNYYVTGLIINSKISFDLTNIFELSAFSALGFFIVAMLTGFYFLILRFAGEVIHHSVFSAKRKTRYFVFAVAVILFILVKYIFSGLDFLTTYSPVDFIILILLLIVAEIFFVGKKVIPFQSTVIMLLIFSGYTSALLVTFNGKKEMENIKAFAQKIETQQDLIAELLFEDIQNRLSSDSIAWRMFENGRADLISQRMQQVYFSGYWNRYDSRILCFSGTGNLISATADSVSKEFYDTLIYEKGKNTLSENLFFTGSSQEKTSYIARLFIGSNKETNAKGVLIILFSEKFIQTENGFPDLYLSGSESVSRDYEKYSFARYDGGKLISGYGSFSYPLTSQTYERTTDLFQSIRQNGYEHLIYHPDKSSFVVISREHSVLLNALNVFSYITVFYSLLLILFLIIAGTIGGDN